VYLIKSFSIYAISSIVSSAAPLFLLPILTRYLTESEYGVIATLTTLVTFFMPLILWGITGALSVEYFQRSSIGLRAYFSSALRIPIASFFLILSISIFLAIFFSEELGIPPLWIIATPIYVALAFFPQVLLTILRAGNNAVAYSFFEFFNSSSVVFLSLLFVVSLHLNWQGRMYAILLSSGISSAIAVIWLMRNRFFVRRFNKNDLKDAFKFGAGLVPHDFANQALRVSDRLFLVVMIGLSGAGQYAVGAQLASIILVFLSAFNRSWTPYIFKELSQDSVAIRRALVKKTYLVVFAILVFVIAFNLTLPFIFHYLIGSKFQGSINFVIWLSLGYFFMGVYMTFIDYIFYVKKTHILSIITVTNLCINLFLNYIFISWFGVIGPAYAFAVTMFIVMVFSLILSNKLFPMPWLYWLKI
jgi:O-antigen/teichoic acid export membrane protein